MASTILRLPEVRSRTGLSRSEIYRRSKEGTFPKKIKLGVRSVGWDSTAVQEFIDKRIRAATDAGGA